MPNTEPFDPNSVDLEAFMKDLKALRREIDESLGEQDIKHLEKIERWGRTCTALGLLGAGIAPNPVSAALLGLGRSTRWMLMHHIFHRAYDKVPGIPERYTSKVFARGRRRYVDYLDWMLPEGWAYDHMLHHAYTNEPRDPLLPERGFDEFRHHSKPVQYILLGISAFAWRQLDYAPSTYAMWLDRHKPKESRVLTQKEKLSTIPQAVIPCFLPHIAGHFVALPLCYLPFGPWAAWSALCNSVMADIFASLHLFLVFIPTHTGEDLYRFDTPAGSRAEYMLRQVLGTTNYRSGTDAVDFLQLWINYQIEHHMFPDVPLRTYQWVQPRFREICERHGIPYVEESVFRRFKKMVDVVIGETPMKRADEAAGRERAPRPRAEEELPPEVPVGAAV